MSMKALEELRNTLCTELDEISKKKEINTQLLDNIDKLTRSIDKIDKIIMRDGSETEYSRMGGWEARGMYDDGNSYANRGQHYVRGHYSRNDGYSERGIRGGNSYRGGYSRDGGDTLDMLRDMLYGADDRERKAIERCMKELGE